jgi:branched-subunit amino acid ABC-type transport system permease component
MREESARNLLDRLSLVTIEIASFLAVQLLNGLAFSLLLFLLAAGLSLIFGMMDVVNLAHGSFFLLGTYAGLTIVRATGSFWLALLITPIVIGALGLFVERYLIRTLYQRSPLDQVLLTFGLAFMLMDIAKWIWGADVLALPPPAFLDGSVPILGGQFPRYRLFVIAAGLALAAVLFFINARTQVGAILRAGVADREMVSGLGIDIVRVFAIVFAVGVGLAGLSGIVAGPIYSAFPGLDFQVLITTLIVVVVGGMGTFKGAFWGSLLIGEAQTFGQALFPDFALFLVFAIMAAVLLIKPAGLFGARETVR